MPQLQILLDQHLSPSIAHELCKVTGLWVTCVRDQGLLNASDPELMRACLRRQFTFCTSDEKFDQETGPVVAEEGGIHHGILVVLARWGTRRIFLALWEFLRNADPTTVENRLIAVPEVSSGFLVEHSDYELPG